MVLFNYATKEITAKIVYYGPGLCGKTTNLQFIYESLPSNHKSKMLSLSTKTDRTLFFDFLPLDLGKIRGMRTKLQLYTVPGQVYYNSTRQLVLKGADGVVFVADSQDYALDANLESMQKLEKDINKLGVPHFESVATTGVGVEETLNGVTKLLLGNLVKKYGLEGSEPLERELHVLNASPPPEPSAPEPLWDEEDPTMPLPTRQRRKSELPMASIEIPLPDGILDSLPDIGSAPAAVKERPATDGLVKEVTVPLKL